MYNFEKKLQVKIVNDINAYKNDLPTVVTIGSFDGVHTGHQKILKRVVSLAFEKKCKSMVVTFEPHPRMILNPDEEKIKLLNTKEEKIAVFAETGIDILVILPFTKVFSKILPIDFIKQFLIEKLNAKYLILGYDHHFGKDRKGNVSLFKEIEKESESLVIEEISAKYYQDKTISSTKIRNALAEGEIILANDMLGYHFLITGNVIEGNKMGRKIGFPTANIEVKEKFKVIPPKGVYAVEVVVDEKKYKGMLNIGIRPTFNLQKQTIEINIFDFKGDIYGKFLKIAFLEHIRSEQKFNSVISLKNQLNKDQDTVKVILDKNKKSSFKLFDK